MKLLQRGQGVGRDGAVASAAAVLKAVAVADLSLDLRPMPLSGAGNGSRKRAKNVDERAMALAGDERRRINYRVAEVVAEFGRVDVDSGPIVLGVCRRNVGANSFREQPRCRLVTAGGWIVDGGTTRQAQTSEGSAIQSSS